MFGTSLLSVVLAVVAGQVVGSEQVIPGQIVRFVDQRAPVGVDPASYVAMVEALARREVGRLGQLIGSSRGFLVERDARAQVLSVDETMVRVKILPGRAHSGREGFLGKQWVEVLPMAGESRVDPKIRALAELQERRAARSQAEQEILAQAFRAQMAGAVERRTAPRPVLPAVPGPEQAANNGPRETQQGPQPLLARPLVAGNGSPPQTTAPAASDPMPQAPLPSIAPGPPPAPAPVATAKKGHFCGAPTKSGAPCKRYVVNGKRCYQHGG